MRNSMNYDTDPVSGIYPYRSNSGSRSKENKYNFNFIPRMLSKIYIYSIIYIYRHVYFYLIMKEKY